MSEFGRIIDGGKPMRKGVTAGINDKLEQLEAKRDARMKLADTVKQAFKQRDLSSPNWNDIQVGQKSSKFGGKKGTNLVNPSTPNAKTGSDVQS